MSHTGFAWFAFAWSFGCLVAGIWFGIVASLLGKGVKGAWRTCRHFVRAARVYRACRLQEQLEKNLKEHARFDWHDCDANSSRDT